MPDGVYIYKLNFKYITYFLHQRQNTMIDP
jgi:hypothetical protein